MTPEQHLWAADSSLVLLLVKSTVEKTRRGTRLSHVRTKTEKQMKRLGVPTEPPLMKLRQWRMRPTLKSK